MLESGLRVQKFQRFFCGTGGAFSLAKIWGTTGLGKAKLFAVSTTACRRPFSLGCSFTLVVLRCRETPRACRPRAGHRGSVQRSRRLWIEGPTLRQRRLPWWGVVLTKAAARLSCTTPHRKHPASFPRPELFLLVVSANQPCVGQACRAVAIRHLKPRRLRHALRRCVRISQPSIFIRKSFSHRQECILHSCWVRSLSPERNAVRDLRKRPRHLAGGLTGPPPPLLFTAYEVTIVALPLPQGLPASCVSTQLQYGPSS
eukprot:COSAG04_NODE_4195_length_2241_cov_2.802054_1_plen_258_part_00